MSDGLSRHQEMPIDHVSNLRGQFGEKKSFELLRPNEQRSFRLCRSRLHVLCRSCLRDPDTKADIKVASRSKCQRELQGHDGSSVEFPIVDP